MLQAYPVTLTFDKQNVIIEFPDVPEAMTEAHSEKEPLVWAEDALVVALSGYVDEKRDIPKPSKPKKNQPTVTLPPLAATKLAIYQSMRDKKITQLTLAAHLRCDARQVRRLLDLNHHSTLEQLDNALHALGKNLVIDIQDKSKKNF